MAKKIFTISKIKNWSELEDNSLMSQINYFSTKQKWKTIAKTMNNKSSYDCFTRYNKINCIFNRGRWNLEEDELLLHLVHTLKRNWSLISKKMVTRSGKQIREDRFINMLDDKLSLKKFTVDEDILIMDLVEKHGKRWTYLKKFFPKRSADKIKNRFNSSVKNKKIMLNFIRNLNTNFQFEDRFNLQTENSEIEKLITTTNLHFDLIRESQISFSIYL